VNEVRKSREALWSAQACLRRFGFGESRAGIAAIMNETRRVTGARGEILVALLGFTSQTKELAKYIGILSAGCFGIIFGV
jgi:hypothetical protein